MLLSLMMNTLLVVVLTMIFVPSTVAFVTPSSHSLSRLHLTNGRVRTPLAPGMTGDTYETITLNNATATVDKADVARMIVPPTLLDLEYDADDKQAFSSYRARQELAAGLRICPLFNTLSKNDVEGITRKMRQVTVPEGGQIIMQGDVPDEEGRLMFFLERGILEAFNQDTKEVFVTYNKRWDHFGELALIFDQPRLASIVAKEDSVLWELRADDFVSETADAPFYPIARELILKKYQVKSLQDAISIVSVQELLELFRTRMRPKGRPVSLHSTLATLSFGCFGCILIFMCHPGTDEFGFPMFLDVDRCTNVLPNRITGFLLAVTSVLGTFRIPRRAPICRRLYFDLLTFGGQGGFPRLFRLLNRLLIP